MVIWPKNQWLMVYSWIESSTYFKRMVKPISLWEDETAGAWPQFYSNLKSTTDYNQQKPTNGQRKV